MKIFKLLITNILLLGLLSTSGCYVSKAGNYVSKAGNYITEKSKAGWNATKSFFEADGDF